MERPGVADGIASKDCSDYHRCAAQQVDCQECTNEAVEALAGSCNVVVEQEDRRLDQAKVEDIAESVDPR
jgi:hypothetical protein